MKAEKILEKARNYGRQGDYAAFRRFLIRHGGNKVARWALRHAWAEGWREVMPLGSIARPDTPMSPRKQRLETERRAFISQSTR